MVERPAQRLLGTHILESAHDHPGSRLPGGEPAHRIFRAWSDLGQPEVEHLSLTFFGQHNVVRLDVAVGDAPGVSFVQRVRDLDDYLHHFNRLEWLSSYSRPEGLALHVLHRDVDRIASLAYIVDGGDIWMIQC